MRKTAWGLVCVIAFACSGMAQKSTTTQQTSTQSAWDRLVDQYFDDYHYPFHPTAGTMAGFHRYDKQLEDYSRAGVDAEIKTLKEVRGKIEKFGLGDKNQNPHPSKTRLGGAPSEILTPEQQADREMVLHSIDGRLLELEEIRGWEKNPDEYSSGITNSAYVIMSRKFAPPEERLKSVIARERQMPKVFEAARANLKNPPKVYTEIALQQLPGIIAFFQKDVPEAFKEVKDPKLLEDFRQSNQAVIESLGAYQKWLKDELLPRSNGDFRIGAENYQKKLHELLKIGYADLRHNQQWFQETAAKIDPSKTPQQILAELQQHYPPPDKLLETVRSTFGDLRTFITTHHIVTIPSAVLPIVEETPPFMRALTFASMDTPGPYEKKAKEAFFNVTLPQKDWTLEHVRGFMAQFNYDTLSSVAVHEAYPGHYVQFLWVQDAPSKVRKLVGAGANAEGWAHYCEQMMLDEGYGKSPSRVSRGVKRGAPAIASSDTDQNPHPSKRGSPPQQTNSRFAGEPGLGGAPATKAGGTPALQLRLGQLQDALLRDARFIVGIEMHTGKMTFDQAVDFFVKEGYQSRAVGETEGRRGTSDPTYLVYTLGKLEIMKLREDYKKKMGAKFSLEKFHNDFLKQGWPPVKIIRREMMGDDSPVL
jgi:hypothetical protein